ncbi:MAG: PHP domain-containing protein [Clostridiales bacterium]|nr:PHP domain-containing protein [Clostridiales bacterium]
MIYPIDLHIHSSHSNDGTYEPRELVRMAKAAGLKVMAVADHDAITAVADAVDEADKIGITCIPCMEVDCAYKGVNLHVLAYGIDHTHRDWFDWEEMFLDRGRATAQEKIVLMNALGFHLTREDLDPYAFHGTYTGELFAEVLLSKEEYKDHPLLKPYRPGGERSVNPLVAFYWDFFSQGKPCYTESGPLPTLDEALSLIKRHGGVPVLAHPGNNLKGRYELFDELVKEGIMGVEAFSSYHDAAATQYFLQKGKEMDLLITCGSDYHGKVKPAIALGQTGCTIPLFEMEESLKRYGLL